MPRLLYRTVVLSVLALLMAATAGFAAENTVELTRGHVRIVMGDDEPAPLVLAVETLCRDFRTVMQTEAEVTGKFPAKKNLPVLVVVNRETNTLKLPLRTLRPLDGFESHRVWYDPATNRIYLDGADMRGTIYAVYTFSEKFLGVPPLWFWSLWDAQEKESVRIPADCDLYFGSPQVRFRTWLPNDTDLLTPWRKLSAENDELWLETMLRLKLNAVEYGNTIDFPYRMTASARLTAKYGLIVASHHTVSMNSTLNAWPKYWEKIRGVRPAPELSLANKEQLFEFWDYCAETVTRNGIENIWNIAFRGDGDKPFWITFKDAPEDEKERGRIITEMLAVQMDLIRKHTKEAEPYVRITFYDEMADLLAKGCVTPPKGENMIWTYVAGRRDHYPYDDIQQFDPRNRVKLGYYMNFQFSSTGAHLAPAEGPWKMEFNYRYVNDKSPLYFSVVNAGNFREFLLTLSANARMLWDYGSYSTDPFLREYAAMYFGKEHAEAVAGLYHDYFYAYWEPKKPDFPGGGLERQYIFQDQRYARAIGQIAKRFFTYTPNPLKDIGYERVPGRTFRIDPADNGTDNQVDAILAGMDAAIPRFEAVAERCARMQERLPEERRFFFDANLRAYADYMLHLSRSLRHFVHAYKHQQDRETMLAGLDGAYSEMEAARASLARTQHGAFESWYAGDKRFGFESLLRDIRRVRELGAKK